MPPPPTILTNMAFWQSPEWLDRTDSIYPLSLNRGDPAFMPWWKEAWTLYRRSRGYDLVHTMGIRESFAYAFLCWITGRPSRQIMTEVFIDTPRPGHPLWMIKTWLYRQLAKRAIGFITNSTSEIQTNAERFQLPEHRFRYVPLNATVDSPEYQPAPQGHLFCAGRTLRDYPTLARVIEMTTQPWVVVAGKNDLADTTFPDRVTIYREIDREAYLSLLKKASIVILPLLPTERATGQVVVLEAMGFGKPVITTQAPGTLDLIEHGVNGYLAEPGDAATMTAQIQHLLDHPDEAEAVGRKALHDVRERHGVQHHARKRIETLEALWQAAGCPRGSPGK